MAAASRRAERAARRVRRRARPRRLPDPRAQVHGKPLVYLDNAATTQKPQAVIDAIASLLHRAATPTSTAACTAERAGDRRLRGGAREGARVLQRGVDARDHLHAQRDRGDQPRRPVVRRPRLHAGRRGAISAMEHHSNIVPWQLVCEESRRAPARGADRRSRRADPRGARAAPDAADADRRDHAHVERARHHHPGARDRPAGARARRAGAGRRRRRPRPTCAWTCRRSTATSTSRPGTSSTARPASACSTARRRCSRRCRRSWAAAT